MIFQNPFKHALLRRECQIGTWLMSASPVLAEMLSHAGYDFLVLDIEHSTADIGELHRLLQATQGSAIRTPVRMASHDVTDIKRALDVGALTLIFPMVNTVEQATTLARACRYPPFGERGLARMVRASRYNTQPDYLERINHELCVIAQIETPEAIRNAMQIAQVPGIDGLFVGPSDLSMTLGHGGDTQHPEVRELMTELGSYCRRAGVALGTVMPTPETVAWAFSVGYTFVAHASDLGLLMQAAQRGIAEIRGRLSEAPSEGPNSELQIPPPSASANG